MTYSAAVCVFVWYVFALFGVSYFKGSLRQCGGKAFTSAVGVNSSFVTLLQYPIAWNNMEPQQQQWFTVNSSIASFTMDKCMQGPDWPLVLRPCTIICIIS